jgi:hypothetical protein
MIALLAAGILVAVGLALVDRLAHWFVIPVLVCGVIIGRDAVDWVRGRVDLLDPVGVIGLLGAHLFFLAPLLHVVLDVWMRYVEPPPDWRDWLGWMAAVNAAGLLTYQATRGLGHRLGSRRPPATGWRLSPRRLVPVLGLALLAGLAAQAVVYRLHGGFLGYLDAAVSHDQSFEGMGWLFMISERVPLVALLGFVILARGWELLRRGPVLVLALAAVFLAQLLLFGGLRGSRSMMVWTMFWAVGSVHVWVRPLSRRALALAGLALVAFMYGYGLYKGAGLEALRVWDRPALVRELEDETGRTVSATLLGDLGRGDVQAYLLYRLTESDGAYGWGRSYVGGLSLLVPKALWPARPPTKEKEGTEALYGAGAYEPGVLVASNVYGMGGEAMLNFGPIGPLVAFGLFGIGVGFVRGRYATLGFPDLRWLLYPYAVLACVVALIGDSDNFVFFLVNEGLVPVVVVALCSCAQRLAPGGATGRRGW